MRLLDEAAIAAENPTQLNKYNFPAQFRALFMCHGLVQQQDKIVDRSALTIYPCSLVLNLFRRVKLKVLVACEYSGRVRDAFIKKGHDAISCDILPSDSPGAHYQGDVRDLLNNPRGYDLLIAHPPCTYLTIAAEWAYKERHEINKNLDPNKLYGEARKQAREEAIKFVMDLLNAPIKMKAIENPVGVLSTRYKEADQFIQPYEYGEDASKKTCLWLDGLPKLKPTEFYPPRLAEQANGKGYAFRWGNQTDSGQNREPPGDDRWKIRSTTWQGWADAMAAQWG
jgi:hypothetical protein